jgi:putative nucleotidyltransferase with HDIG domain
VFKHDEKTDAEVPAPLGELFAPATRENIPWEVLKICLSGGIPEVQALSGVPQPQEYHQEGDAFEHTMLALDSLPPDVDERVFWAVLLHDIGKAVTTEYDNGRWRSHGHAEVGGEMAAEILRRVGRTDLAEDVAWLVRHHGFVLSWGPHAGEKLTRRQLRFCGHRLFPLLLLVARADAAASVGKSDKRERLDAIENFLKQGKEQSEGKNSQ